MSTQTHTWHQGVLLDVPRDGSERGAFQKRKIEQYYSQLRQIHERLNTYLGSHPSDRPRIHSDKDAFEVLHPFLAKLDHEEMWVLNLDTRNRVQQIVRLYVGSVNQSQVRISEIFRQAVINNSPAIIVAHNHPSGDPQPSPDDVAVTKAIVEAGQLLDIEPLDHLIIASADAKGYRSLKSMGLGFA